MRSLAALLLLAVPAVAAADDVLGPADYIKILGESKLRYNINGEPSKTPIQPMTCGRRDERTRLVVDGQKKKLVDWTIKPKAQTLLEEGEALYRNKDYAAAAEKYSAALAVDPQAVSGYYFLGDALLFGKNDAAAALDQYRKGLALDPSMPSGHFFSATALVRLGRNDEAREEIIKALTFHPAYESVWTMADKMEDRWNMKPVVRHKFEPPAGYLGGNSSNGIDIYSGPNGQWLGYAMCKAAWASEPRFRKQHGTGGWSMDEERACVLNQMLTAYNMTEGRLKEEGKPHGEKEIMAALPPLEAHLWEVGDAHLLDGYILFEIFGQHCPMAMSMTNDAGLEALDRYIRTYVIVGRK